MSDSINATGGCYCGKIRFAVNGPPLMKAQCHCRPCQYVSGGGPNYFFVVSNASYSFTQGTPSEFERGDLDNPRLRQFCPTCGTHLTTLLRDRGLIVVKVGTLDDPSIFAPDIAIHCAEIAPFHTIPDGMPSFDTLPPRPS